MRVALFVIAIAFVPSSLVAGQPVQKGGHFAGAFHSKAGCHDRHCRYCCDDEEVGSRGVTGPRQAPFGPIVESFPMMRAVPSMVSMPMMAMQAGMAAEQPRSTCSNQDDRIEEMDAQIEALHLRMQTIMRSVELQTQILQELRDRGSIGGTPLPAAN